jgi:hypothetical protein
MHVLKEQTGKTARQQCWYVMLTPLSKWERAPLNFPCCSSAKDASNLGLESQNSQRNVLFDADEQTDGNHVERHARLPTSHRRSTSDEPQLSNRIYNSQPTDPQNRFDSILKQTVVSSDELIDEILADRHVSDTREDHSNLFISEVSFLVRAFTLRLLAQPC